MAHPEPPAPKGAATTASTTPETPLRNPPPSQPATSPAPAPAPTGAPSAYVPALVCDVRGAPIVTKGASLWGEPQGTTAVASFAGQPVNLIASGFPAIASGGRIRVRTSGGLRIEGFVDPNELPIYTASEVAVVPGHLWIAQGQRVGFSAASNGLTVEASIDRKSVV